MRYGVLLSMAFHGALIALLIFGLPSPAATMRFEDKPIPVEILDVSQLTNLPKQKAKQDPKVREAEKVEPKAKPAPPMPRESPEVEKPEPVKVPEAPKAAEKKAEEPKEPEKKAESPPEKPKEVAKIPDKPKEKPKAKQKPERKAEEPAAKKKALKKPAKPKQKTAKAPKPERKKKRRKVDNLSSVLKSVEKMKRTRTAPEPVEKTKQTASVSRTSHDNSLSISEEDAIRRQFKSCWNLDLGLKDVESMVVSVRVYLNPDMSVRDARILDRVSGANPFYRAFAESARRAVRNPDCSPVNIPASRYAVLKTFVLRFRAQDMY